MIAAGETVMRDDLDPIDRLISETLVWREQHRARRVAGEIEVLCANIRLRALRDARRAMEAPS